MYNLTNVEEKQTSILLEIPLGFSKRFRLSNTSELSLEVEVSYSFPVFKSTKGEYMLDQLGTNHLLNNDIQSESGGSPVLYENSPQIVLTQDGELIDFYRNRPEELDADDSDKEGYFTFSFRPSLMIKKFEKLKYNLGINLSYFALNNDPFQIDYPYFDAATAGEARSIHGIDEAESRIFAGIVFGITF
jgi:hypothetical protein